MHSKTPWYISSGLWIVSKPNYEIASIYNLPQMAEGEAEANATFIVRAVNAYDDLLAALKAALRALESPEAQRSIAFKSEREQLKAAIAKAEGK
jgi:hypothetical protein